MRCLVPFVAATATAAVIVLCIPIVMAENKKESLASPFKGIPRDIDFIKNAGWTQVIVQGPMPDPLISQTKNDRIESVLLVALMLKCDAVVNFVADNPNPQKLTSAAITLKVKSEQGMVVALSFDEKDETCRATIIDQNKMVDVWTKSARMQSILETAVRQTIPILELTYDDKKEITRGKVNVVVP
jgi:hypothetical protein